MIVEPVRKLVEAAREAQPKKVRESPSPAPANGRKNEGDQLRAQIREMTLPSAVFENFARGQQAQDKKAFRGKIVEVSRMQGDAFLSEQFRRPVLVAAR